ncbi:MAG: transposase [Planctomycetota bacterium]
MFHVVNRGVARRAILETRGDRRYFLSRLARGVRKGWIRVHAYSLMTNHFHLLLTSEGSLAEFMQWAMSSFVRRFNWPRDRDGPLFRGRYWARRVSCLLDFGNVVRYIDQNAVTAGLVRDARDFQFGSASHYARPDGRPRWLNRAPVRQRMAEAGLSSTVDAYRAVFPPAPASLVWWVERRLETAPGQSESPTALLQQGALGLGAVAAWLREQAGARPSSRRRPPLVSLPTLLAELDRERTIDPVLPCTATGRRVDPWSALRCGALHTIAGLSHAEIADAEHLTLLSVRTRCARHGALLLASPRYARRAAAVLIRALRDFT